MVRMLGNRATQHSILVLFQTSIIRTGAEADTERRSVQRWSGPAPKTSVINRRRANVAERTKWPGRLLQTDGVVHDEQIWPLTDLVTRPGFKQTLAFKAANEMTAEEQENAAAVKTQAAIRGRIVRPLGIRLAATCTC